jgi:uncharacterized membrane protein required for colicin V production
MIVDLIIGIIIIVFLIIGYKKGLVFCLINLATFIVAIVLAFALCSPVAELVKNTTEIDENMKSFVISHMPGGEDIDLKANEQLPDPIRNAIDDSVASINEAKEKAIDATATEITNNVLKEICFVAIFFLVKILMWVLKLVSRIFTKIPVIEQINSLGGMIVGTLEGIIIVYVIFGVISLISPMLTNTAIVDSINGSFFGKMMYNNNVVVKYIYNGTKLEDSSENKADENNTIENDMTEENATENNSDENNTATDKTDNNNETSENENKSKE